MIYETHRIIFLKQQSFQILFITPPAAFKYLQVISYVVGKDISQKTTVCKACYDT